MSRKISLSKARHVLSVASCLMLLSGCYLWESEPESESDIEGSDATDQTLASSNEITPVDAGNVNASGNIAQAEKELTLSQLQGSWRVSEIANGQNKTKPEITGAIADIYPEQMRWSYTPTQSAAGMKDMCEDPVPTIVLQQAAREEITTQFAGTIAQLKLDPANLGPPHEWKCAGDGSWGASNDSGATFLRVSDSEMLQLWHGGQILRLTKIERATPKENLKPSEVIINDEPDMGANQ